MEALTLTREVYLEGLEKVNEASKDNETYLGKFPYEMFPTSRPPAHIGMILCPNGYPNPLPGTFRYHSVPTTQLSGTKLNEIVPDKIHENKKRAANRLPFNSCIKQIISNLCFSIEGQFLAVCL